MKRYFIGLGSNVIPEKNIPIALTRLLYHVSQIEISRIVKTAAVDMIDSTPFLNGVLSFCSHQSPDALKTFFNRLERDLGRDRDDPDRGRKARPVDLDIIFFIDQDHMTVDPASLPEEPFLRPFALELLSLFQINIPEPLPSLPQGTALQLDHISLGLAPRRLWLDDQSKINARAVSVASLPLLKTT
ncbi:2-amino-4-hydroxy-6-hydroxymethyldihydropteridine diphosphokinase [Magnetococcales bacterium HHB-1]